MIILERHSKRSAFTIAIVTSSMTSSGRYITPITPNVTGHGAVLDMPTHGISTNIYHANISHKHFSNSTDSKTQKHYEHLLFAETLSNFVSNFCDARLQETSPENILVYKCLTVNTSWIKITRLLQWRQMSTMTSYLKLLGHLQVLWYSIWISYIYCSWKVKLMGNISHESSFIKRVYLRYGHVDRL